MLDTVAMQNQIQGYMAELQRSMETLKSIGGQPPHTTNVNVGVPQAQQLTQLPQTPKENAEAFFRHILSKNEHWKEFCDKVLKISDEELLRKYKLFSEVKAEELAEADEAEKESMRKALNPPKQRARRAKVKPEDVEFKKDGDFDV